MTERQLTELQREYFEPANDERGNAIAKLLEAFLASGRGTVILWGQIEEIAGGGRYTEPARYVIRTARNRLRRLFHIATRPVAGLGLRLLTKRETLNVSPIDRRRRAMRQSAMMSEEIDFDSSDMSNADRVLQASELDAAKRERALVRSGLRRQFLRQSSPTNPLRPLD